MTKEAEFGKSFRKILDGTVKLSYSIEKECVLDGTNELF